MNIIMAQVYFSYDITKKDLKEQLIQPFHPFK